LLSLLKRHCCGQDAGSFERGRTAHRNHYKETPDEFFEKQLPPKLRASIEENYAAIDGF
jgi:hypothetical protein